jgi:N-acetylglucosamine-6-sulfatase
VRGRLGRFAPAGAVAVGMGALALLLDHGRALGAGSAALEAIGYSYFALLVAAPLLIYPLAWARGEPAGRRLALSLLPGFLWWLTELGFRLEDHTLPEAAWLVTSPFNALHLVAALWAVALADAGCRLVARQRLPGRRRVIAALAGLLLAPLLAVASFPVHLHGYRLLFQRGLLPQPDSLPGPLPDGAPPRDRRVERPPNVIFILSDDHRWDAAGFEGHPFIQTPALDRLAAEGVRFTRAFVTSSLCSPSRASFLTGTTPHRHGVWNNFTPWSDQNRTFLEYLGRAGYRTAFIGKWHMPGRLPDLRGVDHFVTFTHLEGQGAYRDCPLVVDGREEPSRKPYLAEELTDRALAWIDANRNAPFALYLSHKNVHAPFTPDTQEAGAYAGEPVAIPGEAQPWSHMTDAQYVHLNPDPLGASLRRYGEAVTSLDRQIGRVLDALDAWGLAEDTFVLYTSDNGYLWGEHGLVDKRWAYEESMRIPFLVRHPAAGHAAAAGVDRLILNVDVAPTLLDLAGLAKPEWMQGSSLLPLLQDPDVPWRDAVYYAYFFEPPYPTPTLEAVRTDRHKLVVYEGRPPQLFDLASDPGERRDRIDDPALAATRRALEERLETQRRVARAAHTMTP